MRLGIVFFFLREFLPMFLFSQSSHKKSLYFAMAACARDLVLFFSLASPVLNIRPPRPGGASRIPGGK